MEPQKKLFPVSNRQIEVTSTFIKTGDRKSIADILGISPGTVNSHIKSIHDKLSIQTEVQHVTWAIHNGWDADGNFTLPEGYYLKPVRKKKIIKLTEMNPL